MPKGSPKGAFYYCYYFCYYYYYIYLAGGEVKRILHFAFFLSFSFPLMVPFNGTKQKKETQRDTGAWRHKVVFHLLGKEGYRFLSIYRGWLRGGGYFYTLTQRRISVWSFMTEGRWLWPENRYYCSLLWLCRSMPRRWMPQ